MKLLAVLLATLTMSFTYAPSGDSVDNLVMVIQNGQRVIIDTPGDNNVLWDCTGANGPCVAIDIR